MNMAVGGLGVRGQRVKVLRKFDLEKLLESDEQRRIDRSLTSTVNTQDHIKTRVFLNMSFLFI